MKPIMIILLFATVTTATPVTIEEALQDPQGRVVVSIECCEEESDGLPLWPLALIALAPLPFLFDGGDDELPIVPPVTPEPSPQPTPNVPVPESPSLWLMGFGGLGLAVRLATKGK